MAHRSWMLVAALLASAPACAHNPRGTAAANRPAPQEASVTVHVVNDYIQPVDVYASSAGVTYRMGVVEPGMSGDFPIRDAMLGDGPIRLTAQAADGQRPVNSPDLLLVAGDIVDFHIATHLLGSTATVRQ